MNFTIRPAVYEDIEWLRDLRNANRSDFFDKREVSREAQEAWWRGAMWGDERWVIESVSTISTRRVGYFSVVSPKADLPVFPTDGRPVRYFNSMVIDEPHRGQGAILAATQAFDTASFCYVGYVSEGNGRSLRACSKLGFENRGRYKHPVYGYVHIVWRDK